MRTLRASFVGNRHSKGFKYPKSLAFFKLLREKCRKFELEDARITLTSIRPDLESCMGKYIAVSFCLSTRPLIICSILHASFSSSSRSSDDVAGIKISLCSRLGARAQKMSHTILGGTCPKAFNTPLSIRTSSREDNRLLPNKLLLSCNGLSEMRYSSPETGSPPLF